MSLCLSAHWILSSNGKKSDNLHLLSKLCNSAQFWPFHRKVRNDEKNARKNARDGDIWDIQAPYCSGIGLKLRLDTRKMDICNIPPYCSTREIDLIKDHPLQGTLQTPCRTFPNIWKILKYWKSLLRWIFGSVICDMYNSIDVHASTVSLIFNKTYSFIENTKYVWLPTKHICPKDKIYL